MADPIDAPYDSLDEAFDALSHPYRRRILSRLHHRNPREEESFSSDPVADDPVSSERLAIDTHLRHLPKLAQAGFIGWDREEDAVRSALRVPTDDVFTPWYIREKLEGHRAEIRRKSGLSSRRSMRCSRNCGSTSPSSRAMRCFPPSR